MSNRQYQIVIGLLAFALSFTDCYGALRADRFAAIWWGEAAAWALMAAWCFDRAIWRKP